MRLRSVFGRLTLLVVHRGASDVIGGTPLGRLGLDRYRGMFGVAMLDDQLFAGSIADMGTVLCGGQKQRVLIVRTLYRQPSLQLLDEATSRFDIDREAVVDAAVSAVPMPRIIIAHRPDTIRTGGRVVSEHGTRRGVARRRTRPLANPARSP